MNWDQITGDWKQLQSKVKEKWGKLTDDDLTTIAGQREHLAGLLQKGTGTQRTRPRGTQRVFRKAQAVKSLTRNERFTTPMNPRENRRWQQRRRIPQPSNITRPQRITLPPLTTTWRRHTTTKWRA